MDEQNNIHKNEEQLLNEFLAHMPKQLPFKTPEGYFDSFPQHIREKVGKKKKSTVKRMILWPPVAALAVLIMALFWFFQKPAPVVPSKAEGNVAAAQNKSLDAQSLLENVDFDEDLLISEVRSESSQTKVANEQKVIENYLIDHYDESQLIDEL